MDISNFPQYIKDIIDEQTFHCLKCDKPLTADDIDVIGFREDKKGKKTNLVLFLNFICDCSRKDNSEAPLPITRVEVYIPDLVSFANDVIAGDADKDDGDTTDLIDDSLSDAIVFDGNTDEMFLTDEIEKELKKMSSELNIDSDEQDIDSIINNDGISDYKDLIMDITNGIEILMSGVDDFYMSLSDKDKRDQNIKKIDDVLLLLKDVVNYADSCVFELENIKNKRSKKLKHGLTKDEKKILDSIKTHDDLLALIGVTPEMMKDIQQEYYGSSDNKKNKKNKKNKER